VKRILYIEDNFQNRRLVKKMLNAAGYEMLEAEDGIKGIEMANAVLPDLILMDINMAGMDGMEATAKLKQSSIAHIPIIALTAAAMKGDRERIMLSGCDEYLQKPISRQVLIEAVARFLGKGETSSDAPSAQA
jgi:two-component system, cell cycle response regulator DivK